MIGKVCVFVRNYNNNNNNNNNNNKQTFQKRSINRLTVTNARAVTTPEQSGTKQFSALSEVA